MLYIVSLALLQASGKDYSGKDYGTITSQWEGLREPHMWLTWHKSLYLNTCVNKLHNTEIPFKNIIKKNISL